MPLLLLLLFALFSEGTLPLRRYLLSVRRLCISQKDPFRIGRRALAFGIDFELTSFGEFGIDSSTSVIVTSELVFRLVNGP